MLTLRGYADLLGWPVFPVKGKIPAVSGGFKSATTDPAQIAEWEQGFPVHNIGVPTGKRSGIFVLDIDGEAGLNSLSALFDEHGGLPVTCTVATGGGGIHYFFRWAEGIGNRTGLWPGIDTRGEGGYVVVPPSMHPSGKAYEFKRPPGAGIAEAPEWLIAAAKRPVYAPPPYIPQPSPGASRWGLAALRSEIQILLAAREGSRNYRLNICALKLGHLVAGGSLSRDEVMAELRQAALHIGLGEIETDRTIRSGLDTGMRTPRGPKVAQVA